MVDAIAPPVLIESFAVTGVGTKTMFAGGWTLCGPACTVDIGHD